MGDNWTEEQILDYFVANYGLRVLAQPPAQGFTVLVWLLPVAALAGGGVGLWRLLRRWQNRPPPLEPIAANAATGSPDIAPEVLARIEREIKTRF